MTQEEAIEKARKLFALAQSDNPNEAALAAQRAQEVLARFNIDAAMLAGAAEEPEEDVRAFNDPLYSGNRLASWKLALASSIARHNQAKIYTSGPNVMMVGRPSDVQKVRYLYAWLSNEVERLAKIHTTGEGRVYANNFRIGVVSAINDKLKAANEQARQEARAGQNGAALVKVDNALARIEARSAAVQKWTDDNLNLRKRQSSHYRGNRDAHEHGRREGSKLNVGGSARGALGAGQRALP